MLGIILILNQGKVIFKLQFRTSCYGCHFRVPEGVVDQEVFQVTLDQRYMYRLERVGQADLSSVSSTLLS